MAKKKKTRLNPRPFFVLGVVVIVALGGFFILGNGDGAEHFDLASCLAETGATKYGFDACPNCQTQKSIIGFEAFDEHIEDKGFYVKCRPESEANEPIGDRLNQISILEQFRDDIDETTTQGELCALMVGLGTPTWIINGEQVSGYQSVEELSELSGCPLPINYTE